MKYIAFLAKIPSFCCGGIHVVSLPIATFLHGRTSTDERKDIVDIYTGRRMVW